MIPAQVINVDTFPQKTLDSQWKLFVCLLVFSSFSLSYFFSCNILISIRSSVFFCLICLPSLKKNSERPDLEMVKAAVSLRSLMGSFGNVARNVNNGALSTRFHFGMTRSKGQKSQLMSYRPVAAATRRGDSPLPSAPRSRCFQDSPEFNQAASRFFHRLEMLKRKINWQIYRQTEKKKDGWKFASRKDWWIGQSWVVSRFRATYSASSFMASHRLPMRHSCWVT